MKLHFNGFTYLTHCFKTLLFNFSNQTSEIVHEIIFGKKTAKLRHVSTDGSTVTTPTIDREAPIMSRDRLSCIQWKRASHCTTLCNLMTLHHQLTFLWSNIYQFLSLLNAENWVYSQENSYGACGQCSTKADFFLRATLNTILSTDNQALLSASNSESICTFPQNCKTVWN